MSPPREAARAGVGGRPLVLDAAMGSELPRRGIPTRLPLWSAHALLEAPDVVRAIHADHAAAGAEVLTANTFRTNPRTLERCGLADRQRELTALAVRLAREAAASAGAVLAGPPGGGARPVLVAGSIAPVEDCYEPELVPPDAELEREHAAMARSLAAAGCDLLLIETMNTLREARTALAAARETGLPAWVSFVVQPGGRLLSGEDLSAAAREVVRGGAELVLVNCAPPPVADEAFGILRGAVEVPCGVYPNYGHADPDMGWTSDPLDPEWFGGFARRWFEKGAGVVGGCCGTTVEHVRAIVAARQAALKQDRLH
jgi:S-methylmethionine-dependent homocysteine/selenocysteine methylase